MTTETTNRYLVGNFAPVTDELTATDLPVEGNASAHSISSGSTRIDWTLLPMGAHRPQRHRAG